MDANYRHIQISVEDHVAGVRLNRPPVNALSRDFVLELTKLAKQIGRNGDVWVVALSACGKAFCAGADLKERARLPRAGVAQAVSNIQRMALAWIEVPQPVLAAVHGAALGGGLELALAADIIVASRSARLGFPEVSLGIIPAAGGTQRIAQRASLGAAGKWVLSAGTFSAAEALRDGVVDYVVPAATFARDFDRIVCRLASSAPLALRQAKKALNAPYRSALRRGLKSEQDCYRPLIHTRDRAEALQAFMEKRKPLWRGN